MNIKLALPAIAGIIIAASTVSASPTYWQITSADEFQQLVVGNTLSRNRSSFMILPDGSISGLYAGRPIEGTWEWVGDSFCRTLTTPTRRFRCQFIKTDGENATFMPFHRNADMGAIQEIIARRQ